MKTIIFDMDGTLIDSKVAITKTINFTRKTIGLEEDLSDDYVVSVCNDPTKDLIYEFYGLKNADINLKKVFEEEYVKNYSLYANKYFGVDELLKQCKENNYFVALASNAPSYSLGAILQKNDILQYFNVIVGANENTPSKPNPFMINKIINDSNSKKTLFVGDSIVDETTAINANIFYIQATWGFGKIRPNIQNANSTKKAWEIIKNY